MKILILGTLLSMLIASPLVAQQVKKVQTINEAEVPAAVRQSFVENFGEVSDGTWTVAFHILTDGIKTTAQPLSYTFRKGSGRDKIEVRFSPDGRVESAKGIEKQDSPTR